MPRSSVTSARDTSTTNVQSLSVLVSIISDVRLLDRSLVFYHISPFFQVLVTCKNLIAMKLTLNRFMSNKKLVYFCNFSRDIPLLAWSD